MDKAKKMAKVAETEPETAKADLIEEEKVTVEDASRTFSSVGLAPWLIKNLKEVGIEKPTQI